MKEIRIMRASLAAITFTILALLCTDAHAWWGRHIVSIDIEVNDGYVQTDTVVQDGCDSIDRFTMHRVKKIGEPTRAVFLALPPLAATFATYTFDEDGDLSSSFAGRLASEGIEVWGYTPREAGISAGQCEGLVVDCSAIGDWGLGSSVDDALYIVDRIKDRHPWKKVIPGGLSYGSAMAIAMVDRRPHSFGGLALWESAMWSDDDDVIQTNAAICDSLDVMLGSGIVYDTSTQQQKTLVALAQVDPAFHQLVIALLDAPPPSPVTSVVPNFSLVRGDVIADAFLYGSEERVFGNISSTFMDYTSIRKIRDANCSLGGDDEFVDNLAAYDEPVLLLESGRGMGPWMMDQVNLTSTNPFHVEEHYTPDYGHVDLYMDPNHDDLVEDVIIGWINDEVL